MGDELMDKKTKNNNKLFDLLEELGYDVYLHPQKLIHLCQFNLSYTPLTVQWFVFRWIFRM